jgi:AraC-like DNA-binding protein
MDNSVASFDPRRGALPDRRRPQLYLVQRGYILSPEAAEGVVTGFAALILVPPMPASLQIRVGERVEHGAAMAIKPMVPHEIVAGSNLPVVTIGVSPNHALYRNFRTIGTRGVLPLERDLFAPFERGLAAIATGRSSVTEGVQIFDAIVEAVIRQLPPASRSGRPIERALELLRDNPHRNALDELARAEGLSYSRMSLLFSKEVGLSLRSYLLWRKLHTAAALIGSGLPLTEVAMASGFVDSAHLSATWRKVYGVSPTYVFNHVRVHSLCQSARESAPSESQRQSSARLPSADLTEQRANALNRPDPIYLPLK